MCVFACIYCCIFTYALFLHLGVCQFAKYDSQQQFETKEFILDGISAVVIYSTLIFYNKFAEQDESAENNPLQQFAKKKLFTITICKKNDSL